MKKTHLSLSALALALSFPPLTLADSAGPMSTDRIIIKYKAAPAARMATSAMSVAQQRGVQLKPLRKMANGAQVVKLEQSLSLQEVSALAADIARNDSNVEYAEPDRLMHAMMTPNDARYYEQWDLHETIGGMRLPQAWDKSTGTGVIVAVLDTGYRPHVDLNANIVGGYDFISDAFIGNDGNARDSDARDPGDGITAGECGDGYPEQNQSSSWHGTHVAGTISAITNNGAGVAGVAPGAKVLPLRVLGKCGGYTSDIADAIIWASGGAVAGVPTNTQVARVINMSLGGEGVCDNTTQNAINSARSRGTVVIVAAGNENQNASNSNPANCAGVVAIAATGRTGGRAPYSNYGSVVDVAAPGGDTAYSQADGILSTLNNGYGAPYADIYGFYQGTSMATPHVAGVAALMLARNAALTPDTVEARLKSSARSFPASCSQCGTGIVDANAAVDAAGGGGSTPPPPSTGVAEIETNNTRSSAQRVSAPATINGTMASASDTDYFRVSLAGGKTLSATLTPGSATADYELYVYNGAGVQIAKSTNSAGQVDAVSVSNTTSYALTRYVRVVYYSGGTGASNGKYTLKLGW